MATTTPSSSAVSLRLITAALAFLDGDAAFGGQDSRTLEAKTRLREMVDSLVVCDAEGDPPQLHVVHGRASE